MKCINIKHPDFKKLLKETGKDSFELETDILLWQDRTGSDGFPNDYELAPSTDKVREVFNSLPELSNIGTPEQYANYLSTIFPDSKVTDIIYHGAIESLLPKDGNFKGYVTYFTNNKNYAETFGIPVNRKLLQAVVNIQNPYNAKSELADVPKEVHDGGEYTNPRIVKENNKNYDSVIGVDAGQQEGATFAVFEPEQIHVLGTQKDIQGFKQFVQSQQNTFYDKLFNKSYQKLTAEERSKTVEELTKDQRSLAALENLMYKLADRIGGEVYTTYNPNAAWKGYNEGRKSVINLAYATADTPFHEILAHPIIRAIKEKSEDDNISLAGVEGFTSLYDNLLKELDSGVGKIVFDQVQRDYTTKLTKEELRKPERNDMSYSLEDGPQPNYYSEAEYENALYQWEQRVKAGRYTLEEQQEEAIVTLLGLLAQGKLDKDKDASLIRKLRRLWKKLSDFVRSLLKQDGIEIDKLPITTTLDDLANIMAYGTNKIILPGYKVEYSTPLGNKYDTLQEVNAEIRSLANADVEVDLSGVKIDRFNNIPNEFETPGGIAFKKEGKYYLKELTPEFDEEGNFIGESEKTFEISKDRFISQYKDSPDFHFIDKNIETFIEKNKQYEQSKEIIEEWKKVNNIKYDPEEVYSRGQGFYSSIGAYSNLEVDLLFQNLLGHIEDNKKAGGEFTISAFTKPVYTRLKHIEGVGGRARFVIYPKPEDIKWAASADVFSGSVWDANEKVSKDKKSELLGVSYTKAPSIEALYKVTPNLADIIDKRTHDHNELGIELTTNNFRIEYDYSIPYQTKKIIDKVNKILDDKYGKIKKPEIKIQDSDYDSFTIFANGFEQGVAFKDANSESGYSYKDLNGNIKPLTQSQVEKYKPKGKQPTQTKENLKQSIEEIEIDSNESKKYTSQAEINTKIARLKEVARRYPRSLIKSEVVPIREPQRVERLYSKRLSSLENNVKSLPDAEVDQKLTELLNKSGISVSKQKVYAEGYETRNGKPLSVAGKADLTNNLIEYDPEVAGKNTLGEETMHFVVADNEGQYDFNRAMRLVEQHPDYQQLYDRYYPIYKSDYKTKMEILGKLGAPILNERIKSPLLRYFKRMLDRVLSKLGNVKAELRVILDKFGQTFIDSGIQNELEGTFYDVGDVGYIAKAKKIYDGIVSGLHSKLSTEKQKGYKPYKLEKAYYDILDADHTKGMLMFIDYMKEDSKSMVKFLSAVDNGDEVITHDRLSQMHHALMFYRKNIQRLEYFISRDFKNNPDFNSKDRKKLLKQVSSIVKLLNKIEASHRVHTKQLSRGFAKAQAKDAIQDKQKLEQELKSIDDAINEVDYDMNQLMYWVGSLAHAKDAIVKGLHAAIVKANKRINRFGYRLGQELIGKSNELGVKDMVSLMEKSDGKHTGFLQTRLRRGAWQLAFEAERQRMHEKYDLPIGNKAEERELRQQIKHEWRQAALEYERLYKELGDRDKALGALTDRAAYEKGIAYRTEWAKWFNRNTKPVANLNDIINEKKKTLSKEDYEYWYNQNVGRAANGDLYYKNELVEPSDGSMSAKKEKGGKVQTVDWTNYDYNKLSQSQKDMIEYLESKLKEADTKHTKIRQNYRLPQVRASFVNMVKDRKFGNIGDQIKEEFQRVEDDTEYGEKVTYADGTVAKFVPMHFVTPLKNPDTISTDLLYSVMLYGRQAEDFKTKASLEPVFQTVLRQLGERTVNNETGLKSEAYKAVEKFIDMNIYGQRKEDFIAGGINISKGLTKLKNYVTANNLVFNLFTTVAGYMTANVYSKIEDLTQQYTNQKAKNKAEITFDTNVHKALLELGRPNKTSKFAVFLEEHGIIKDSEQTLKNLDLSRLSRTAINSGLYAQYEIVKYRVRGKLALALAHDLKYVKNEQKFFTTNELKSQGYNQEQIDNLPDYWDMHEVKDSKLVAKHKDKAVFERYANKVDYLGNNLEGELDPSDYAAAHQHAVLQLVTTHRGWLFRNVQLRFKPKGINYITGQEEVGYYSGFFDFVKSTFFGEQRIKDLKSLINRWQELDNTERYAVRRTMYELAFVNAIASIAFILNGVADDDDESWLKQYLAYQSNRILLEVSALNPFPAVAVGPEGVRFRPPVVGSINEIVEILNSPIAATRQLEDLQDLMFIFSSEEIERGPYEGMTKTERALLKLNIGTKGYYQVRSAEAIEASNRFIKNKTLEWLK